MYHERASTLHVGCTMVCSKSMLPKRLKSGPERMLAVMNEFESGLQLVGLCMFISGQWSDLILEQFDDALEKALERHAGRLGVTKRKEVQVAIKHLQSERIRWAEIHERWAAQGKDASVQPPPADVNVDRPTQVQLDNRRELLAKLISLGAEVPDEVPVPATEPEIP